MTSNVSYPVFLGLICCPGSLQFLNRSIECLSDDVYEKAGKCHVECPTDTRTCPIALHRAILLLCVLQHDTETRSQHFNIPRITRKVDMERLKLPNWKMVSNVSGVLSSVSLIT